MLQTCRERFAKYDIATWFYVVSALNILLYTLTDCFEATEFTSGVCNASNVGSGGNASSVGSGEPPTPRSKRAASMCTCVSLMINPWCA